MFSRARGAALATGGASAGTVTTIGGTVGTCTSFSQPMGVVYAGSGTLYVTDEGTCDIDKITGLATTPVVTFLAGDGCAGGLDVDGTGVNASFNLPSSLAYDAATGTLFVGDAYAIREVTTSGTPGVVTTVAGGPTGGYVNGFGTVAVLNPNALVYDSRINTLFLLEPTDIREVQL